MPFPVTTMLDDFNRDDEGPPPSNGWTTGIFGGTVGLSVVSNQCSAGVADGDGYLNGPDYGPDCECYASIVVGTSDEAWVYARLAAIGAGTTDGYAAFCLGGVNSKTVRLYRLDNGVATQLGSSWGLGPDVNALGLRCSGNGIYLYHKIGGDFQETEVVSDATYSAAGKVGLRLDAVTANLRADDFGGGTFTDSGTARAGGFVVVGP